MAALPSRWLTPARGALAVLAVLLAAAVPAGLDRLLPTAEAADSAAPLSLNPGDHVAVIGNTLADRMQHDGWLETMLHSRFPTHKLVVRDLGFSGDELTLRLRSAAFGSPDEWLAKVKADVVVAMFGYNESFAGPDGLDKFKKDLDAFVKHTLGQKYSGQATARLVLVSPAAFEDHKTPNLPDGKAANERLAQYTAALAEVARANKVPFVDLFAPTARAYAAAKSPMTINGVHFNTAGNRLVAETIDRALFGPAPARDGAALEKVRAAVLDKNHYWFNRYRTVDGYSIYGGRADLRFVNGQTNREVAQREMEVLDVMTANRDPRIWAAAQGRDLAVNDDNTPPFIPVITNKPGPGPNGAHLFLDGDEAVKKMTVGKGLKVNLFASEGQFPELANPVQMSFDARGRLWVAVWPTYPHWKPKEPMNDKLLILEDTDGDGRADRCTVFADNLHCPTGFELYDGGVLVAQAPDLVFLKDTDGDGKADVRERVVSGLDSADTHHTANSFVLDPGGALYFQEGTFHHTQVETPYGPPVRCANAGVFRYEPRSQKFDVYVTYGFANPHGHVFDRWGQDIVVDGTGANPYHGALFSGHLPFPQKHAHPPQVYQQRTRPCPGMEYLTSRHFPDEFQGNLLVANVIGFQGILRYKIEDKGSSLAGTELEPILSSTDPNFRPSDLKLGPDGALWFIDWHNPIIGHMQHNLRDPSRDRTHGRIYRVTYQGRELLKPPAIAGQPVAKLLDLLREPEDRTRYRTRIELSSRPTEEVVQAVAAWVQGLDAKAPDHEHALLEALWVHQQHNVVNPELLNRVLASKDFRARAAAARVLSHWRDRVPGALETFKKLAADPHPRVRLEAVRAASFFPQAEAVEVVLVSQELPGDAYLDFTRGETMKALDGYVRKAIAEGRSIPFTTAAGARYFLKSVRTDDLLKMKRTPAVLRELLLRPGVRDEVRLSAAAGLAEGEKSTALRVLLDALKDQDTPAGGGSERDESVSFDLVRLLTARPAAELAPVRPELESLAVATKSPVLRQLGYVALAAADGHADKAWALASRSPGSLRDLVAAMPIIRDPGVRASLYPKVEPLLKGLPPALASSAAAKGTYGRYVRVELPGRQRTLTLAEVEVLSDGRNVARQGKASQKNTSHGGEARRAIDGNKSPIYGDGGQTHSAEGADNPWWEVDLGSELPIDSIVIYNRGDGALGSRLSGYTLKVLDGSRKTVFEKKGLPTPMTQAAHSLGEGNLEASVRRAAMNALISVRGQEAAAFKALAGFVKSGADRHAAVEALLRIPPRDWPADEARPLLDSLTAYVRALPTGDRTSHAAVDALQLAEGLAGLLPADEARKARRELGELGVRMLRLGTVTDQMSYDKERLVVKAGKPVEVLFENTDLMPHNVVLTVPGALEEVGNQAEAQATQPGAFERHFVPASNKILVASRLLQPRESQKLSFTAPSQPGVYPYVCTYPGHWRRMHGALYVVADLEEYQADAEAYLKKNPLPVKDELLKYLRPRKEWAFDELAASVSQMDKGRSFANARQLFQVAACVSCHKFNGVGQEFGPDLTKIEPKWGAVDILREVLEPSRKIDDKYASYVIETQAGKTVTGMILEETPQQVKLIENPLAKAEPLVLKAADIAERKKSLTSIMPKGLLDKLTKEEILDLIAYVTARGSDKHPLFQGGHDHGAHNHGSPGGHQH